MRSALVLSAALALLASAPARADDTYETKAAGAEHVRHLDDLVWALTEPCTTGDDTEQRQCRHVRDVRAHELAGATLVVDAEPTALAVGAWDPRKKSVPVTLSTCIACGGVAEGGKTWYVVAGAPPAGGALHPVPLHETSRMFADAPAAKAWTATVAGAVIELIVKVPPKPTWSAGGKQGLALDVVGYRVFTPCSGAIVFASPPSGPAPADKQRCARPAPAH